jgi:hypothetical protein
VIKSQGVGGISLAPPGGQGRKESFVAKQATELRYAVRFRVVFKYFGQLCLVLAALSLVPLVMSVIFGDTPISLRYGIVIGGLSASGFSLTRRHAPSRVQASDETTFRIGDEIVILTHSKNMPALQERWQPKPAQGEPADAATPE